MQACHFTDEASPDTDLFGMYRPLRVVIAYDDLAAGKRAMRVMVALAKRLRDGLDFKPLPWPFELLSDMDCRNVATSEAVNADILIIATSNPDPLPEAVSRWAETAIKQKQGTVAAVVALFGPDWSPDGSGSSRLRAIQNATRQAGLDFFAPASNQEPNETIARIHQRAEMMTPVLEGILHHPVLAPAQSADQQPPRPMT